MGAPVGNQNAARGKVWQAAIMRALEARQPRSEQKKAIDDLAAVLLDKAYEGDMTALKELGDRLDGKPVATIAGDEERPLKHELSLEVIGVAARSAE